MISETNRKHDHAANKRKPKLLHREDWAVGGHLWKGYFEGTSLDTEVTVLFYATDKTGEGPRLHVHPYDEIFIIRTGRALFTIGEKVIEAREGDILLGPAKIPHKYHNLGPGPLETTDIHLSNRWVQTNLEDPALSNPQAPVITTHQQLNGGYSE